MRLFQTTAWAVLIAAALLVQAIVAAPQVEKANPSFAPATVMPETAERTNRRAAGNARSDLIIPVANVPARNLVDTWGESRSEGRTHEGIDIMAPSGAPVRAVADGRVVKFFDSDRGGITIYQFDTSERFVYYYAHLDRRAHGLAEGAVVNQGDVIGYVGMTGNAPVPHLHFEIQRLTPDRRWWEADSINPYPFLRDGRAPD